MIARLNNTNDKLLVENWLRRVWSLPAVQIAISNEGLWVKTDDEQDSHSTQALSKLPGAERFQLDEQGRLIEIGKTVPTALLPQLKWHSVRSIVRLELPIASHVESLLDETRQMEFGSADSLNWVPMDRVQHATAITCKWDDWYRYALSVPLRRLQSLRYAVRKDRNVIVIGEPLPGVPCTYYLETDRILIPSPYTWSPRVPAVSIRKKLRIGENDWLLWTKPEYIEMIRDQFFLNATRVSIRATNDHLQTHATEVASEV